MSCSGLVHRRPVLFLDRAAVAAGGSGRVGAGAQGAVRPVRPADRGRGALRHPLEGGVRAVADAGVVRPFHPGVLAQTHRRLGSCGPGVRRGRAGHRGDRDPARPSETVRGFDGVRRRGRHPGHGDPAGGGDAEGGATGARREIGDRAGGRRDYSKPASRTSIGTMRTPSRIWCWTGHDALAVLGELCGQDAPHGRTARTRWGCWRWWRVRMWTRRRSDGTDGRWRIARRVAPDRVISTVDQEARHTRKSKSVRRDGFRGHVGAEPETGLITDAELTSAAGEEGSDPVVGQQMIARDRFHRPETQTPHPDPGDDAAPADKPQADEPGGDEAVAEPPAATAGDSGEITTAGTIPRRRPPRPASRARACGCTATRPTAPEPPAPPIGTPATRR